MLVSNTFTSHCDNNVLKLKCNKNHDSNYRVVASTDTTVNPFYINIKTKKTINRNVLNIKSGSPINPTNTSRNIETLTSSYTLNIRSNMSVWKANHQYKSVCCTKRSSSTTHRQKCKGNQQKVTPVSNYNPIAISNRFTPLYDYMTDNHKTTRRINIVHSSDRATVNHSSKNLESRRVSDQVYSELLSTIQRESVNLNSENHGRKILNIKSHGQTHFKLTHKKGHNNIKQSTGMCKADEKHDKLSLCFWNGQSIVDKSQVITDFRTDNDIDIYLFVETWLSEDNHSKVISELKGETCNFINYPRPYSGRGGGIGCLYKKQLSIHHSVPPLTLTSMQALELCLSVYSKKYTIVVIYRSEPVDKHKYAMSTFFKEFSELLAYYNNKKNEVIFTGDFNFHVNNLNNTNAKKFMCILDTFNLIQHIHEPTHKHGNTLDLIITRKTSKAYGFRVSSQLSDHNNILFNLDLKKPEPIRKIVTNRQIRRINKELFKQDITRKLVFTESESLSPEYLNNLVGVFNSSASVLDIHAPLTTREVTVRDRTPWTSDDIRSEKQKRRKLEKKWNKSKLQSDYDNFKAQKNADNTILKNKRDEHITNLINEHKGDPKTLFKVFQNTTAGAKETLFPKNKSDKMLAEDFSKFFTDKINRIRAELDSNPNDMHHSDPHTFNGAMLSEFTPLSQDEVKKLILESNSKSCDLDPIPVDLIKYSIEEVLPIITEIINTSLTIGIMPDALKHAQIRPLLKKLDLELINKNYRPVSNLSFLSKLIESAVIKQYQNHLEQNGIHDIHQSAYKKFHSTETLLTKVKNDIQMKMDNGQVVMLVLLDLSAAFDTIDHDILLDRLNKRYGITGSALKWFRSYLTGRTQSVIVNGTESGKRPLLYGVPQGSKLGPILFNSYIAPLSELVREHGINDEKFADDEELILAFSADSELDQKLARQKMISCIADIRDYLKRNKLCNNGDKTELLIIGTKQQLSKLKINSIRVNGVTIQKATHVRNLGVIFDENLTMEHHIKKICKTGYFHLKNIAAIRNNIDKKDTEKLVHAFISSTLDYGNALLYGISNTLLNKLQILQNSAARLIEKLRKYDHITESLKKLHWLPVKARIEFKTILLTWKALHNLAPPYIKNMLVTRDHTRTLRNPMNLYLNIPKCNRITLGGNAFSFVAPTLWNRLPRELRDIQSQNIFKTKLKTFLFIKHYHLQ